MSQSLELSPFQVWEACVLTSLCFWVIVIWEGGGVLGELVRSPSPFFTITQGYVLYFKGEQSKICY